VGKGWRMRLLGRQAECHALDRLLTDAIAGHSGVMVLRGEAGIGKSALLTYVSDRAQGTHVAKAVGVESEMELAYSGLQQLCGPMLDRLARLPQPQRIALATVFGLSEGSAPDRFLVGLATLTLFADVAEHQPLVCIVEDAQWLDQASEQTLAFVARRLLAERLARAWHSAWRPRSLIRHPFSHGASVLHSNATGRPMRSPGRRSTRAYPWRDAATEGAL
jgi:AAA ATPase domain